MVVADMLKWGLPPMMVVLVLCLLFNDKLDVSQDWLGGSILFVRVWRVCLACLSAYIYISVLFVCFVVCLSVWFGPFSALIRLTCQSGFGWQTLGSPVLRAF